MRFKKTVASLLVGASVFACGGAVSLVNPNTAEAGNTGIPAVTFTGIDAVKAHHVAGGAEEMYLMFISKDTGSDVVQHAYLAGGTTEDSSARLMHFAKQIKYVDGTTGNTYNFASAGKVTAQGTTAGDEGNKNLLFQKVDEDGNVIPFNMGDCLIFPQGMVYETDTNGDAVVDTVWKFDADFTVEYRPGDTCADTMGCVGQGTSGDQLCNATTGYHVFRDTTKSVENIVAASYYGGASNSQTLAMRLANNTTLSNSTVNFGYGVVGTAWYRTDAALLEYIQLNGTAMSSISNTWLAAMDAADGLYLGRDGASMLGLSVGDTIAIPQDVTFTTSGGVTFTTMAKFTWTYNGATTAAFDVTATYYEGRIPARVGVEADLYGQGGGESGDTPALGDRTFNFTQEDTQALRDSAYDAQTKNKDTAAQNYYYKDVHKVTGKETLRPGTSWDVDYKSTKTFDKAPYDNTGDAYPWYINNTYTINGEFVTAANAPADSDGNGAYKFSWGRTPGTWYPSIMFNFTKKVEFNKDDDLEITMYLSENMDSNFTLWATSALTKNVWDAQKKFTGSLLAKGQWITINMSIKDFLNESGTGLAPIAFTFVYSDMADAWDTAGDDDDGNQNNDGIPAAEIYFDKVEVKTVVKTVEENYKKQDVSEVVPFTKAETYTGECTTDIKDNFDFNTDMNIKFIRTDVTTESVKMKLTINDTSSSPAFDMYFVMNGTGKYYEDGGLFYWISNEGVNVGYTGKAFGQKSLADAGIQLGVEFELELRAIPYYVEGIKKGYYTSMLVNGVEACESGYISFADCSVGTYFGFYMHTSKPSVTATVAPVNQATTSPVSIKVSTTTGSDWVDVDDYLELTAKVKGNIYGAQDPEFEIVGCVDADGNEISNVADVASISWLDGVCYFDAFADAIVTVKATVTNQFGTFESEPFQIALGNCELPEEDSSIEEEDSSIEEEDSTDEDSSIEEEDSDEISTPSEDDDDNSTTNNSKDDEETSSAIKEIGCGASVGFGVVALVGAMFVAGVAVRKNKED